MLDILKKTLSVIKKIWANEMVRTTAMLLIITAGGAFALAGTSNATAELIEENKQKAVHEAMEAVLPEMTRFTLTGKTEDGLAVLYYAENRDSWAFAVEVTPMGYGGKIDMIVGVSSEGTVTGVSIVGMNETPGLGTKIQEPQYMNQFIGKTVGVSVGKGENGVDAIAGVTVSTHAVTKGVADALAAVSDYRAAFMAEVAKS